MSLVTIGYRYVLTYFLTLLYTLFALALLSVNYAKKAVTDPGYKKLKLVRPDYLVESKYGVHKYIKVNNVKLHYVESGDPSKPLMIFLHGFPDFWYSWRHQIVEFQKDYWCIAVDMRGYGDSERPESVSAYKIEILVEDIRDLVRQLGREKFILVAHDWGGIVASKFRDMYPKVLSSVILLATTSLESLMHCLFTSSQRKSSWYMFFFQMPAIPEQVMEMNHLQIFDKMMLVPGKDTITKKDLEAYKYWFGKQFAFTYPINYYRANFKFDVFEPQKRFTENVPMLLALAANDPYVQPCTVEYMKKVYDNLETTVVEDSGHFLQQEEPVRVNNLIKEFLAKHKP